MFGLLFKSTIFKISAISLLVFCLLSCENDLATVVDITDIPSYYFENDYLDERANAINGAIAECAGDYEAFFWISDIHWEPDLNTRNAPLLIKYLTTKTGINKILNGGDTGNSQVICKNAISQFRNSIGSNQLYTVTGNHEINDASRYEKPFLRVADELRGHCSDIVYGDGDRSYFYFDNNEDKVRYIGLSTFGLYLNGGYESCYTPEQLDWFNKTALNVREGWSIVIFTHSLYDVDTTTDKLRIEQTGANGFINVIDNYKGDGTIVCVLMGHTHRDRIHFGKTGVPYIISASDRHATYKGDINVERIPGTTSEQHFEVVIIDKESRNIKMFSIGAKARNGHDNDPGEEVDVRIIHY